MHQPEARCRTRRLIYSLPLAVVASAAISAAPASLLATASAAAPPTGTHGTFPSTSAVTATPSTIGVEGTPAVEQAATLKATVTILSPLGSLIVSPSGQVTFTVGTTTLGSGTLGGCSVNLSGEPTCNTSISTTALPLGTDVVTAAYPGDGIAESSYSTTSVLVRVQGDTAHPVVTQCASGSNCDTGTLYSDNGSADLDVQTSGNSGGAYTITSSLGGTTLSCTAPGTGDSGNYVVSSSKVSQTVTYQMLGSYADTFNSTSGADACYGTTQKFTTASGHPATFNSANNEYEGTLPTCNSHNSNTPCEKSQTFVAKGGPQGQDAATLVVLVSPTSSPCDPHLTGGG